MTGKVPVNAFDADHGEGPPVEAQRLSEDPRVLAVLLDPRAVSKDYHGMRHGRRVLLGEEGPAQGHVHAEDVEVVPGHELAEDHLRLAVTVHACDLGALSHDAAEDVVVVPQVGEVRIRRRRGRVSVLLRRVDVHQPLRVGERQVPEEHRVDEAEHRRVRADPQRQ
jgi:hypothetical protein